MLKWYYLKNMIPKTFTICGASAALDNNGRTVRWYYFKKVIAPGSKATSPRYRPTWYDIRWYHQTWYRPISSPDIVIEYHSDVTIWCRSDIVIMISFRHRYNDIILIWIYNHERISAISFRYWLAISEWYRGDISLWCQMGDIGLISDFDINWYINRFSRSKLVLQDQYTN